MADDHIIDYIKKKEEFIENDFKLRFWVEILFFNDQKNTYDEKLELMEKKLKDDNVNAKKMKKFLNTNPFKNANRNGKQINAIFRQFNHIRISITF
jgi:endonuclease III-like uncharacterized protein